MPFLGVQRQKPQHAGLNPLSQVSPNVSQTMECISTQLRSRPPVHYFNHFLSGKKGNQYAKNRKRFNFSTNSGNENLHLNLCPTALDKPLSMAATSTLSAGGCDRHTRRGREELHHVRGQGQKLGGPHV